jgi:hypothetical protein
MLLCNGCNTLYDDNICQDISKFIICKYCYNYHSMKLIPIVYDKNDNKIYLKSLHTEYNLLEHANLLIHFSKKQIY